MRITGYGDRQIRAGQPADRGQDVMIPGTQTLHLAGTVQMQINAVDLMEMFLHRADKQRFDVIEGFARDHAGGPGAGIHGRNHVDPGGLEYLTDPQLADTVVAEAEIVAADLVFPRHVGVGFSCK